ncbi:MAG: hypothetical protein CSA84_07015 [Actinomycetales bacterium]|nr:MAG: hypothetical protein CSA84_07015 [Actinomycetales bacterium]
MPWFAAAIFLGVLIQHLNLDMVAKRGFNRHGPLGVILAAAVGALSPFCSFTVIPLISRLLRVGVPLSVIMAFWIASPVMDPEIFALSAAALGVDVAVARLLGAIVLSVGAGLIVLSIERRGGFRTVLRPSIEADVMPPSQTPPSQTATAAMGSRSTDSAADAARVVPIGSHETNTESMGPAPTCPQGGSASTGDDSPCPWSDDDGRPWQEILRDNARAIDWPRLGRDMLRDLRMMGKWLVLAIIAQGVIVRYVPQDWVTSALGTGDWWAIPLAAGVGVPLYLNGVGAIPITQGLLSQGMMPGAAVTFLLAGAMTTVPAMVAVRAVVRWNAFAFYAGAGLVGSMAIGAVAQLWL